MKPILLTFFLLLLWPLTAQAAVKEYHLHIAREIVAITGTPASKITINGTIPGPVLTFTEGQEAVIHVTNHMNEPTSVHWHGLLLPGFMDGVPGFNSFPGIDPGETFTYRFKIRQSGTYWYHAHSATQEQDGHYGALVIHPKGHDPVQADRDYVVLLSDFTEENGPAIMANLKKNPHYYNYAQRTIGDFFADTRARGFGTAWRDVLDWGQMRMSPTDLADVSGYTFLVNGKTPEQNWTGIFKPGERVRLRFINASAMSIYDVRIPGLELTVVQADGQNVEPVSVDEFRFSVAETYDVIVTPREDKAYTIAAESIDRTGFALGTLAPREGMRGEMPQARPRTLLTMADMGHGNEGHESHGAHNDHGAHGAHESHAGHGAAPPEHAPGSGWAEAGTPPGHRALRYADLRFLGMQKDTRPPEREIVVTLGGNMERFIWTLNGKKFSELGFEPIQLEYGERVRIKFVNKTMMAHPMHLHGMFVQLENGQPAGKLPNKHTVNIAPGHSYAVLLTADEPGEWAFHCHMLFHMEAGMMTKLTVAAYDPARAPPRPAAMEHHDHEQEQPEDHRAHQMPVPQDEHEDHGSHAPAPQTDSHEGHHHHAH